MTLFTLLHWYACLWSFAALGGLWVHTEGIDLATDSTWIEAMGMQEWQERDQDFEIYVIALYVSIVAMFGGVGSVPPSNRFEYGVLVFILFTGCFFWAYVISTLCALLSTLNPHKTEFRNTMDALNHFMDDYHLTTDHRVRIRQFFRASRDFTRRSSYHELMSKMSERLRGDTSLIIGVTVRGVSASQLLRTRQRGADRRLCLTPILAPDRLHLLFAVRRCSRRCGTST